MLSGHFAPALLSNKKALPKGAFLYFLVASQLQDLLWLIFHYLGLEPTSPTDAFDVTLESLAVDMLYSHDLLPQIAWLLIVFLVGRIIFKSTQLAVIGAAITLSHLLLDLLSGYPHYLFGADTQDIALGLYVSNAYLAILIEVVFTAVALWFFFRKQARMGIKRTRANQFAIIGIFAGGILFILFIATISMRTWFGIPEFDIPFNTAIPTLILTYIAMIIGFNHLVSKYSTIKPQ